MTGRQTSLPVGPPPEKQICTELYTLSFIDRPVCGACAIVSPLLVHAESVPSGGTEDLVLIHIVHANRYAEHRSQRDKVGTNVAETYRTMVCAPVVHNRINILERRFVTQAWHKPSSRPCRVGALVDYVMYLRVNVNRPSLGQLKHWAKPLDNVQASHGDRHAAL